MGLITKEVEVTLHPTNIKYYEDLGYEIPRIKDNRNRFVVKIGTKIKINVKDLTDCSHIKIEVECDSCKKEIKNVLWKNYKKYLKVNGKYYCRDCAKKLYGGENKRISQLKNGKSFEQWCIENNRQDVLDRWDYELNDYKPNEISYSSNKKQWLKCPNIIHGSELKNLSHFTSGYEGSIKCNQCNSLGYLYPQILDLWSNKNKKSAFEYSSMSLKKVWWKCPDNKHKDFLREISRSNIRDFRCPSCQFSKGETCIETFLLNNNIIYIPQKEFDGLLGVGNGNLSYDFYLPDYNLLIEYQGEQHERYIKGFHKSKKDFRTQVEHDRRKKEYTQNNNIKLLEIWYWDYDNIESILQKELSLINLQKAMVV